MVEYMSSHPVDSTMLQRGKIKLRQCHGWKRKTVNRQIANKKKLKTDLLITNSI